MPPDSNHLQKIRKFPNQMEIFQNIGYRMLANFPFKGKSCNPDKIVGLKSKNYDSNYFILNRYKTFEYNEFRSNFGQ